MKIYINDLSLTSQYNDIEAFTSAIVEFTSIVSIINKQVKNKKIFKDFNWVYNTAAIYQQNFQSSIEMIKDKLLKDSFKDIVFNKSNPIDWKTDRIHLTNDLYYSDILKDIVTDTILAEAAERKLVNKEGLFLVLNFIKSTFENEKLIKITKNEEITIEVDCVENKEYLQIWLSKNNLEESILKNSKLFKPTNLISPINTKIYEELTTNYLWYFDNFHKNHFEVFNKQKIHLGEGDLNGYLNITKRDPDKDYKLSL